MKRRAHTQRMDTNARKAIEIFREVANAEDPRFQALGNGLMLLAEDIDRLNRNVDEIARGLGLAIPHRPPTFP